MTGGTRYVERPPAPPLRGVASAVWVQQVQPDGTPYVHRHVPHGAVELVCRVGSPPRLVGPLTGPREEALEPGTTVVGVRFLPGAVPALTPLPASELVGRSLPAEEVWGRRAAGLGEAVAATTSAHQAVAALQRGAHELLRHGESPDPLVAEAVRALDPWRRTAVTSVGAALHISETQLRRRFRAAVGISPKALHRLLRFQGFLALVQQTIARGGARSEDALALLARAVGYADQSHLNRECARLTGTSPGVFVARTHEACACGHDHAASFTRVLRGSGSASRAPASAR